MICGPELVLSIVMAPWNGLPVVNFCSECDGTYLVEKNTNLVSGAWGMVQVLAGNGKELTFRPGGGEPSAFFRASSVLFESLDVTHVSETAGPTVNSRILAGNLICGNGLSAVTQSTVMIGEPEQCGLFVGGKAAGLGVERGVVFSTGRAEDAEGQNQNYIDDITSFDDTSTYFNRGSFDLDLDALATGLTDDAAGVEFDFNCIAGTLRFKYAFASEEYDEFVFQGFNDIFAVFLDGEWIDIESAFFQCPWIKNTSANTNGLEFAHAYDGFIPATDPNNIVDVPITAGRHTIKFVIADVIDGIVDTSVFIGGVSVE